MILNDININYIEYGNKKGPKVILLHAWGQSIEMMKMIGDYLSLNNYIYILDLPGFGISDEPIYPWTIEDYNNMLKEFIKEKSIKNPILIGHSFGGKIAIKYASDNKVSKLVLMASSFEKSSKSILKTTIIRLIKKVPILNKIVNYFKDSDYYKLSLVMQKTFENISNVNLTEKAKKINCPTIIVWGNNDQEVSIEEGKKLHALINNSELIEYDNGSHFAYLEQITKTNAILDNFLRKNH